MNTGRILAILLILIVIVGGAGVIFLARAPMMPQTHTVEQVVPDDRIPR